MDSVMEPVQLRQFPKVKPPTVAEIVGPPPSLPTLPSNHVLQPLVEELRSWVASCVESYEIRERQRRDIMASCIATAHQKAVDATRRMTRQLRDLAEELDRTRDRLAVADRDATEWKRRALEFSATVHPPRDSPSIAASTAAEAPTPNHNRHHHQEQEQLQTEVSTLKAQV
jgi:hypothetical protein